MTLIFNHLYYVTYFFFTYIISIISFVYIMSIIAIKHVMSLLNHLLLFQYIVCIMSFDLYHINYFYDGNHTCYARGGGTVSFLMSKSFQRPAPHQQSGNHISIYISDPVCTYYVRIFVKY